MGVEISKLVKSHSLDHGTVLHGYITRAPPIDSGPIDFWLLSGSTVGLKAGGSALWRGRELVMRRVLTFRPTLGSVM